MVARLPRLTTFPPVRADISGEQLGDSCRQKEKPERAPMQPGGFAEQSDPMFDLRVAVMSASNSRHFLPPVLRSALLLPLVSLPLPSRVPQALPPPGSPLSSGPGSMPSLAWQCPHHCYYGADILCPYSEVSPRNHRDCAVPGGSADSMG